MDEQTTTGVITAAQKTALVITGGGIGLSLADVTAMLQFLGAATGAIAGCWVLWDRWQDKSKKRKRIRNAPSSDIAPL